MKKNEMTVGTEKYVEKVDITKEKEIVCEIKFITEQTSKMLLMASIEIGKRLTEAKSFVKHGEWEAWLKERVQFSQRTANIHMQIFKEYGETGLAQNSQSIANLNYTQAMKLLAIPSDEREKFVEENNAKDLTIKELEAKIKALTSEKTGIQKQLSQFEARYEKCLTREADLKGEAEALKKNIQQLEKSAKEAENQKEAEIQRRFEALKASEEEKLKKIEEEKDNLKKEIKDLKDSQALIVKKAQEEEKKKAEKEFAKREAELNKEKKSLQEQLEKAGLEVVKANEAAHQEATKNKEMADITKCTLLISDILDKYKIVMNIIQDYRKINPKNADDIMDSLEKSLNITEKQSQIHMVS